jgi:hypothetical protein
MALSGSAAPPSSVQLAAHLLRSRLLTELARSDLRVREMVALPELRHRPRLAHWSIPDPAPAGDRDLASYPAFERAAADIDTRIRYLLPVLTPMVVFFPVRLIPGDPARVIAGDTATPEQVERIRVNLGSSTATGNSASDPQVKLGSVSS